MSILELQSISYSYDKKSKTVLNGISYQFDRGNLYAITGKSGAGKTTLLSLLSGLAVPTDGKILLNGQDISTRNPYEYRSREIGVIFQSFNLLPKLTAIENVMLSMEISGVKYENKRKQAMELLQSVAITEEEAHRRILKLSGGQQQRVAIARALSYGPRIILADEPTGNLDAETQKDIIDIFLNLAHCEDCCVILVTHSKEVAQSADTVYHLQS